MSKQKNIRLFILLCTLISILFILTSVFFVYLTDYSPKDNHFLLNTIVWLAEYAISYFIVMGVTKLINKKTLLINKWIIYTSSAIAVIFIALVPGGFESIFVATYFGVLALMELIKRIFKQKQIKVHKDDNLN